jgi:hypothetical protein
MFLIDFLVKPSYQDKADNEMEVVRFFLFEEVVRMCVSEFKAEDGGKFLFSNSSFIKLLYTWNGGRKLCGFIYI